MPPRRMRSPHARGRTVWGRAACQQAARKQCGGAAAGPEAGATGGSCGAAAVNLRVRALRRRAGRTAGRRGRAAAAAEELVVMSRRCRDECGEGDGQTRSRSGCEADPHPDAAPHLQKLCGYAPRNRRMLCRRMLCVLCMAGRGGAGMRGRCQQAMAPEPACRLPFGEPRAQHVRCS